MLRSFAIENNKIVETNPEFANILVYIHPDEEERQFLVDTYKLDEHTLASTLDPDELARLEFEPDHAAFIGKRPKNYSGKEQFLFRVSSYGMFLFKDRLIFIIAEDYPIFDGKLFNKCTSVHEVVLKLIYQTIFHYLDHLKIINMISEALEHKINSSMENTYLLNLFSLEKSLVYYVNAIHTNGVVLEKIRNGAAKIGFTSEQIETLDDIIIENNQCFRQAEIYANILAGLMDARASIVNNNLNHLIKQLTIISVVFMPLNILASMGGMSEFSIMTKNIPPWVSYGLFSFSMVGIGYVTYLIIRRITEGKDARLTRQQSRVKRKS